MFYFEGRIIAYIISKKLFMTNIYLHVRTKNTCYYSYYQKVITCSFSPICQFSRKEKKYKEENDLD